MSFIMLESILTHTRACTRTHRPKKKNFLKRLSGARQAPNLTHTHFFRRTIKQFRPCCCLDYRPLGTGISESVGVVQSEYLAGHLNNAVISAVKQQTWLNLLIRSLKQLALANGKEAKGENLRRMRKWKAVWLRAIAISHTCGDWNYILSAAMRTSCGEWPGLSTHCGGEKKQTRLIDSQTNATCLG